MLLSTPAAPPLRIRVIGSDRRAEAAELWRRLEETVAEGGLRPALACSWAWTGTWLEHYGDAVAHRFVVGEDGGRPRGIALLTEAPRRPLRPRTVHVGTAGEPQGETVFVERNALLCAEHDRRAFSAAVMSTLADDWRWDRLRLDGLLPADADALLAVVPSATLRPEQTPIADLRPHVDVLDALPSSRRRRARRTLRAFGPLAVEWAETTAEAHAVLDELIALHQARWTAGGEPGAFSSTRFTAFHRALVDRLVPEGRAALVRVHRGEETVGCLYGLVDGDRLLFYQGGLRRYDDNRLRAGLAAHVAFMRACRDRGLAVYDFLAPATRYKEELATRSEQLVWAEVERASWRTGLAQAHRRVRQRTARR